MPNWQGIERPIRRLEDHQVFVFGSNRGLNNPQGRRHTEDGGFHGTGAASLAWRGTLGAAHRTHPEHWSNDPAFLRALNAPRGHPDRTGRWAQLRVCRGPMQGREGKSYAVYTVTAPGQRRSIPLDVIGTQLAELCTFAAARSHLEFLVTPLGEGYAGYSQAEMDAAWPTGDLPGNLRFVRWKA